MMAWERLTCLHYLHRAQLRLSFPGTNFTSYGLSRVAPRERGKRRCVGITHDICGCWHGLRDFAGETGRRKWIHDMGVSGLSE